MAETVLLICFVCLIILMAVIIFNHYLPLFIAKRKGHVLPKGTFSWPLFGETLPFIKPHPSNTISTFLQHHCSRYGKVFKSHLFFTPTIVSCDEELNYFILQNEEKLFQNNYPKTVKGIVGDLSMMVAVGETHKRQRSVVLSLIPPLKSNPQFLNKLETFAIQILDSWKHKQVVLFSDEAKKVLGFSADGDRTSRILKDFLTFLKGFISLPINFPGTNYARAVKYYEERVTHQAMAHGIIFILIYLLIKYSTDYVIPSGWQVLPVVSAVHLEAHKNGSQFQPSRWEDKDPKAKIFTPFGGGIKQCPGSELAKTIVAFFLHHLVLNFRWGTKDGDEPIAYPYVEFKKGLPLSVEYCPFDQEPAAAAMNKSKIN